MEENVYDGETPVNNGQGNKHLTSLLEEIALDSGTAFSFESEVLACAVSARVGESVGVEDDDTSDSEEFV